MLIIEYSPTRGAAYSDLEAEQVVLKTYMDRTPGRDDHLCVSTANVIEAAVCLLRERVIPAPAINFKYHDKMVNPADPSTWPPGFCDYSKRWQERARCLR